MQCHKSAAESMQTLLDEGKKGLRLHPYDEDRVQRVITFLDALERLDSEMFCAMVEYLRSSKRKPFRDAFLALREVL